MAQLRQSDGYVSRVFGDDTIVVPVRAGVANLEAIFTLNAVASAIWRRIDGTATIHDLVGAVVREFDVTEAEAANDVEVFVDLLASKGLVQSVPAKEEAG